MTIDHYVRTGSDESHPEAASRRGDYAIESLVRLGLSSQACREIRACLLMTRDREQAMVLLKQAAAESKRPLYHFSVAGRRRYDKSKLDWDVVGSEVPDPHGLLRQAGEVRGGGYVILEDCIPYLRDEAGDSRVRMELAQMLGIGRSSDGLVLVFLEPPEAESLLPSKLADRFVRVEVRYPRIDELETIAREELATHLHREGEDSSPQRVRGEAPRLASRLAGMTHSASRDLLRDALCPVSSNLEEVIEHLDRRKDDHLGRELSMRVLDTDDAELPIGLDYLTQYVSVNKHRIPVWDTQREKRRARGILLVGPPGTGKTMLARAIGKLVELPVVDFRISSLMNSLLGETERRFAQAFATLEAMAPNVVFIDEIEKAFGDSSERDGGTMRRVSGSLLTWLSDNTNPNFIVATANGLQAMGQMGYTMTRSERFDNCFFVDVPGREARRQMLTRWLNGKIEQAETIATEIAEMTERFSGADIYSAVKQAGIVAEATGQRISVELLRQQIERKRMRAFALYDEFDALRRWGRTFCEPAGPVGD